MRYFSLSKKQLWGMKIIEVTMSNEAKLSGIYEIDPRCGINSISHEWLLDKHFTLWKSIFWLKQGLKKPFFT